jgi:Cytochrome P460
MRRNLPLETVLLPGRWRQSVGHLPQRKCVGRTSRALALQKCQEGGSYASPNSGNSDRICGLHDLCSSGIRAVIYVPRSPGSRYLPQYTAAGELILPKNSMWREWVLVGSPLTPNALNDGHAAFPEYHNVYIEPGSYAIYKKTNVFPEGAILFKELQLTKKPEENPDGSRTEPSGRGYFPGEFNDADVTVKDSKRFAATGGWGYFDFNHSEPKAPTAKVRAKSECAFCHIGGAKKDEVWTQFYRLLDK